MDARYIGGTTAAGSEGGQVEVTHSFDGAQGTVVRRWHALRQAIESPRGQNILSSSLISINAILIVLLAIFTARWRQSRTVVPRSLESEICVPETSFISSQDFTGLSRRQTGNTTEYCGVASTVLGLLVEQATKDKFVEEIAVSPEVQFLSDPSCLRKPGAKVQGTSPGSSESEILPFVRWEKLSFLRNEVDFNGTHLRFGKPGYYYIYAQIEFNPQRNSRDLADEKMSFRVNRRGRDETEAMLLEGIICRQNLLPASTARSSFAGSVFQVGINDTVYVWVSHPAAVTDSFYDNFLGAFLI